MVYYKSFLKGNNKKTQNCILKLHPKPLKIYESMAYCNIIPYF